MPQDRIEIPIFYGTYSDLTRIDLNFMNGKIVTYKGRHFRDYIKKMVHDDQFLWCYNSATSDLKERHFYVDNSIKKYAIVPIDFEKPFLTEHWQHFHQMLLSIYPSDFSLIEILYFNLSKEKYTWHSS